MMKSETLQEKPIGQLMKKLSKLSLILVFIFLLVFSQCGRRSSADFRLFNRISNEVASLSKSKLGLDCIGSGASAPQGIIRSWILFFDAYGIPTEQEAFELLLRAREIADDIFRSNPAILSQMYPEYTEGNLFDLMISFRHLDGSPIESDIISAINIGYGKVRLWKGGVGESKIVLSEPYEDFLARFPDTTLRAHRLDEPKAE